MALLLVASLTLVACNQEEGAGDAGATAAPPAVTVANPLVKQLVEWDEFTARFAAVDQVDIRPRVTGYLQSIHFEDGALVEEGDLLFVIDRRPFEVALDRAQADLDQAQASVELARLELDRAERLVSTSAVARSTFDSRQQESAAAQAMLEAARADIARAELDLEFAEIRAPLTGRISDRRVDVGNLVQGDASPTLLTTIVARDPIYALFDMSEREYLAYQRAASSGDFPSTRDNETAVAAKLADEDGWPHEGTMNFVDNVVDDRTGTIRARALFPNPDGLITPGQFATIRLPGSPLYPAVLIPDSAVVSDQARKLVMTVLGDGTVEPVEVRLGPREFGLRVVRDGLTGEERIIVEGLMRARPGQKVTPEDGDITLAEEQAG